MEEYLKKKRTMNINLRKAFLVSLPRSGSTLMQRLLGEHERIISPNEPWILLRLLYPRRWAAEYAAYDAGTERVAVKQFLDNTGSPDRVFAEAVRLYADHLYHSYAEQLIAKKEKGDQASDEWVMLDKTPRYYLVLNELRNVYPDAPIILLRRNPLAILASMVRTWTGFDPKSPHFSNILPDLLLAVDQINDFAKAWESDERIVSVHYEDLVENPKKELTRLCDCLKVEFQDSMLNYTSSNESTGILGDKVNVNSHTSPEKKFTQAYKKLLSDAPQFRQLAVWFMLYTGSDSVDSFGYNSGKLISQLIESGKGASDEFTFVQQIDRNTGGQLLKDEERLKSNFIRWTEQLLQKNELRQAKEWINLSSGFISDQDLPNLYRLMLSASNGDEKAVQQLIRLGGQTPSARVANKAAVFLSRYKVSPAIKIIRHAASLAPENAEIQENLKALRKLNQ